MARLVKLCDKNGITGEEVEVELGFKYELLFPVILKDKEGNVRDGLESVTFNKMPNRKLQKAWAKIKDTDERQDKMFVDMTGVKSACIDEMILHDSENIGELLKAFLPESMLPKEVDS